MSVVYFLKRKLSFFIPELIKIAIISSQVKEILNSENPKFDVEYLSKEAILRFSLPEEFSLGAIGLRLENNINILLPVSSLVFVGNDDDAPVIENWGLMSDEYLKYDKTPNNEMLLFLSTVNVDIKVLRSHGIKVILGEEESFMFISENNDRINIDEINNAIAKFKKQKK